MPDHIKENAPAKPSRAKNIIILAAVFLLIIVLILILRRCMPEKESTYRDAVADEIAEEMKNNNWVISAGVTRRTVADFSGPIITEHGGESRLIVHTAKLSETVSLSNEGLGGWKWTSTYQTIIYEGEAQYTVNLSRLSAEDFSVNNELKQLTVRIPYAELDPISIPADKIKFQDLEKGWLGPRDIKLTPEESTQLQIVVCGKMKARLIDENIIDEANEDAKNAVQRLLSGTVSAVDPEFTVIVVQ